MEYTLPDSLSPQDGKCNLGNLFIKRALLRAHTSAKDKQSFSNILTKLDRNNYKQKNYLNCSVTFEEIDQKALSDNVKL